MNKYWENKMNELPVMQACKANLPSMWGKLWTRLGWFEQSNAAFIKSRVICSIWVNGSSSNLFQNRRKFLRTRLSGLPFSRFLSEITSCIITEQYITIWLYRKKEESNHKYFLAIMEFQSCRYEQLLILYYMHGRELWDPPLFSFLTFHSSSLQKKFLTRF